MYSILKAESLQSKAFVSALLDTNSEILHKLLHGHKDTSWAYPGANKHGYLLKQLCNSLIKNSNHTSTQNLPPSSFIVSSTNENLLKSPPTFTKQLGGNGNKVQVYNTKEDPTKRFSNIDLVTILQKPEIDKTFI